ncbi:MAG: CoA transferase, partial [Burkholderiaceae bacterium]
AQWLTFFRSLDLACAPVKNFDDIRNDEHLKAVGLFREYDHPTEGLMREVRLPVNVQGINETTDLPPPNLGQDTAQVLRELGYSDDQLVSLRDDGVITGR